MFACLLTYLLTPWCRVLLEKLTGLQLVKKFPAFHRTRRFITALTSVRHLSLSWASPIQSIYPHPTSWRSILILSTHLRLGLPSGLFPSGFPTNTLYTPLSSPIRAICPAYLILLDFISRTQLGEEYRSFSSSLCNLLHSRVTSSLLGPNILLNTMFSNTLSFLSSRNVSDQVSHPYKTTGKIRIIWHLKIMFISSVSSYYIFEYCSSKRKKQPDRGNNSFVFHTFILLFLKVSFFYVTPGRVGLSGFAIKTTFSFPSFSKRATCNVHFTPLHLIIRLIFGEDYNDPPR